MRNLVRTAMVVAVALSLGTVVYAVAETGLRPDVAQIPTVVTGHPADLGTALSGTAAVVQPSATPTPLAEPPVKTKPARSSGSAKSARTVTRAKSARSAGSDTSSRLQSSATKSGNEERREVVTPEVRDESDDDGHESVIPQSEDAKPQDTEQPQTETN